MAFIASTYVSILISDRFNTSPIATVIESTNHHISEIPFPAVTICPSNQLNFSKKNEVINKFLQNRSPLETQLFVDFLERIHNIGFWQFERFNDLLKNNASLKFMESVNVTQITLFVKFLDCFMKH